MKIKYILLLCLIVFLTNCKKHKKESAPSNENQPNTATSFFPFSNTRKWVYAVKYYSSPPAAAVEWPDDTMYYVKDTICHYNSLDIILRKYQFTSKVYGHDIFVGLHSTNNAIMYTMVANEVIMLYNIDSLGVTPPKKYRIKGLNPHTFPTTEYYSNLSKFSSALGDMETLSSNTISIIPNDSNTYDLGQIKNDYSFGKNNGLFKHTFTYYKSKDTAFLPVEKYIRLSYEIKKVIN